MSNSNFLKKEKLYLDQIKNLKKENNKLKEELNSKTNISENKFKNKFEKFISSISANFIHITDNNFDKQINKTLKQIGKFAKIDRSYMFLVSPDMIKINNTHEWCAEGIESHKSKLQNIEWDTKFPWLKKSICNNDIVHIPDVNDLPEEANLEKTHLINQKIKSLLTIPMSYKNNIFGFIGFDAVKEKKQWSLDTIRFLKIVGFNLVNTLEHLRAEKELKISYRNIKALIENTNDFILISDNNGFPILYNSPYAKLMKDILGVEIKPGLKPYKFFKDKNTVEFWDNLHKRVLAGEKFTIIFSYPHRNKKIRHFEVSFYPIKEKGNIKGFSEYARDITERIESENQNKILYEKLSEKNNELRQLLYCVSHDLRSPLINIHGFSGELEKQLNSLEKIFLNENPESIKNFNFIEFNEEIKTYIKYIKSSTKKIDNHLNALLTISRLEHSKIDIKKLNINKLLKEIINSFMFEIKNKNIKIKLENLPDCNSDYYMMYQIFLNLISNAIKYLTPERNGIIKISGKKENDKIIYSVKDNGKGIQPKYINKIFEIFYRINIKEGTGKGIGLTIVYKSIKKLSGEVYVESTYGKGSTFVIKIPENIRN